MKAIWSPSLELQELQESLRPDCPFVTTRYVASRTRMGEKCILFLPEITSWGGVGVVGFVAGGAVSKTLTIPSATCPRDDLNFWQDLHLWARQTRIDQVAICSFGSDLDRLPSWHDPLSRRTRVEWRLNLKDLDSATLSSNHRRNLSRAEKAHLVFQQGTDLNAVDRHLELMGSSLNRRAMRGEDATLHALYARREIDSILATGSGQIFQVSRDGCVESSLLVLVCKDAAYYHSAGTSENGMSVGASIFLIWSTARQLRESGFGVFNLAGAGPENPGLQRFKAGFGAAPLESAAAHADLRSPFKRRVTTAVRLARHPLKLGAFFVSIDRSKVYRISIPVSGEDHPGDRIASLDIAEISRLEANIPAFRGNSERIERDGFNAAYALFSDESAVHLAWLIDSTQDAHRKSRDLTLKDGEFEITHCVTREEFRGRGVYGRMILALCREAGKRGARELLMLTSTSNTSSQAGIQKAGLKFVGHVVRCSLAGGRARFTLRLFRIGL